MKILLDESVTKHLKKLLLTIDKNLMFQQNLDRYSVTIAVLNCTTSKIDELLTFLPSFFSQVNEFAKHKAHLISKCFSFA
ncbi:MAG: hypothetical protein QM541_14950 [Flavobacterium sp.]|nr:hypothetical protein [Flavobacterium sp.]